MPKDKIWLLKTLIKLALKSRWSLKKHNSTLVATATTAALTVSSPSPIDNWANLSDFFSDIDSNQPAATGPEHLDADKSVQQIVTEYANVSLPYHIQS